MKESIDTVKKFYDESAVYEWNRLEHEPFEFRLTTWMMDRYIRPGDSILDIGGGPGRYSIHYSKKGCAATLVDLSDGNIALAKQKAAERDARIYAYACNCLELDSLLLGEFDHVFLMGPLYHLLDEADRVRAVELAVSHLKPGGKLYVSFILEFAAIIYYLQNAGVAVEDASSPDGVALIDALEHGGDFGGNGFTKAYFYNQHSILPFMQRFGLNKLHLFGQEGFLAPNKYDLVKRGPEELDFFVALAKRFIELPELLSYSEHAMYIGEKPKTSAPVGRDAK